MASTVGERIRERRTSLKLTQDQLAQRAGISKGYLSDLENDKRSVGADTLLEVAEALSVSLDYLMKGDAEAEKRTAEPSVGIPAELEAFALRASLTFRQARQLLGMRQQIVAHRSADKAGESGSFDWARFYESVKQFLD
jgi:transcriptional regulator with XRE-family HTH domain